MCFFYTIHKVDVAGKRPAEQYIEPVQSWSEFVHHFIEKFLSNWDGKAVSESFGLDKEAVKSFVHALTRVFLFYALVYIIAVSVWLI